MIRHAEHVAAAATPCAGTWLVVAALVGVAVTLAGVAIARDSEHWFKRPPD